LRKDADPKERLPCKEGRAGISEFLRMFLYFVLSRLRLIFFLIFFLLDVFWIVLNYIASFQFFLFRYADMGKFKSRTAVLLYYSIIASFSIGCSPSPREMPFKYEQEARVVRMYNPETQNYIKMIREAPELKIVRKLSAKDNDYDLVIGIKTIGFITQINPSSKKSLLRLETIDGSKLAELDFFKSEDANWFGGDLKDRFGNVMGYLDIDGKGRIMPNRQYYFFGPNGRRLGMSTSSLDAIYSLDGTLAYQVTPMKEMAAGGYELSGLLENRVIPIEQAILAVVLKDLSSAKK
jgi:hypothetical protein